MLLILGTNAIDHALALQDVFRTKQGAGLFVTGVGAQHFTGETLATFFVITAVGGLHLQQHTILEALWFFRVSQRSSIIVVIRTFDRMYPSLRGWLKSQNSSCT